MAISLLVILLTPQLATALDYELLAPSEVEKDKPFEVEIKTEQPTSEFYDVKIFVTKHTREYSEIYSAGNWQSPFKYIQKAFPEQTKFQLRAHITGETIICSRLRSTEPKNEVFEICNQITVSSSAPLPEAAEEKKELAKEEPKPQKETISETKKTMEKKKLRETTSPITQSINQPSPNQTDTQLSQTAPSSNIEDKQIILKSPRKNTLSSKKETPTIPLLFALTILLIVVLTLLFFRAL